MQTSSTEISVRGMTVRVQAGNIRDRTFVVTGKLFKVASIRDEEWIEGEVMDKPAVFVEHLRQDRADVDLFTFAQRLPDIQPQHPFYYEWDNLAAIPITTYEEWFEKRAEYDVRKAVRRAARMGVVVRAVPYDEEFVRGIMGIYNESPVRQGRPFWHYGKDFETVRRENGTYQDRSEYIGAFFERELIGFIKMVYVGTTASTMQVISKTAHFDKRPVNALISKAVEICVQRKLSHFIYHKFRFGSDWRNSLTEFKSRNGFEEVLVPRYYVPLTWKGALMVELGLHHGFKSLLPAPASRCLLGLRSRLCELRSVQDYLVRRAQRRFPAVCH